MIPYWLHAVGCLTFCAGCVAILVWLIRNDRAQCRQVDDQLINSLLLVSGTPMENEPKEIILRRCLDPNKRDVTGVKIIERPNWPLGSTLCERYDVEVLPSET